MADSITKTAIPTFSSYSSIENFSGLSNTTSSLFDTSTGTGSFSNSSLIEGGFIGVHSWSDVFGTYSFGANSYQSNQFNIAGYTNGVSQQNTSTANTNGYWYDVGGRSGYVQNFVSGNTADSGVLNFTTSNISSFSRESDFLNFHMADGTSFQVQNSSSTNDVIQFSTDGVNVSFAKIGYANQNNSFIYEDGVNYYAGSNSTDVLNVTNYQSRNIWLDGSDGNVYDNINNIDASDSYGNNTLAGGADTDNEITAGNGNDLLWGGSGRGNDTLYGGAGDNTYFYGNNNGNYVIVNSVATDSINLYDVSLTDIVSANEVGSDFVVNMRGGNSLVIQGEQGASNFVLSDQSAYNYNRETHVWTKTN